MAFCTMNFWGASLQKQCSMNVILPEGDKLKPPFGLLIQLHGLSDDHTIWARRTSLDRYVAELPLVVVMPDGGRSFYCDAAEGPAYEAHIMKDVIGFAEKCFPVRKDRRARAIGGLSMGGYGAMKLGLKFPNVFASVVAHSSAFDFAHNPKMLDNPERRRITGDRVPGGRDDIFALAEKCPPRKAPALRFDCGLDDGLLDSNRRLHKHLAKLSIRHEYREYPGDHNWAYWDEHARQALRFHMKHLAL
jgi:S-formylglutathione hydrolase FrmB